MKYIFWRLIFVASFLCRSVARAEDVVIPTEGQISASPKLFVVTIAVASFSDSFWQGLKWPVKDGEAVAQLDGCSVEGGRCHECLSEIVVRRLGRRCGVQ